MVALLTGCTRPSVPSPAPEKIKEGTRDRLPTMPVGRRDEQNGQGAVAELGMFLEDRILWPLASMLPSHFFTLVLLPPGCFSTFRCQACLGPGRGSVWLVRVASTFSSAQLPTDSLLHCHTATFADLPTRLQDPSTCSSFSWELFLQSPLWPPASHPSFSA